ncbi:serine/threonine-protein phosphatase 6 regulatory ankyrin repeat subunit A-like [Argiope bruennichi]|uniref:Putative ankyrin repeat protein FPV162 like protein n=1 Tax=Argiope bruennichi TaxID=94029 RepID=A0A8T0FWC8_ARGBR|nr:serine/threonine-protein phosphatase 6 regulatory ankyrin repeat subunit A-like [Argiope bruennichi]KAF8793093.1 putative ankyrin repeat protein FPV162 like protein [Argiope bruennichi]
MDRFMTPVDRLLMSYLKHSNPEPTIVLDMLDSGANVNCRDMLINSPLHYVLMYCSDKFRIVQMLLEYGANPSIINTDRNSTLHLAVKFCEDAEIKVIQELLNYGASVRSKDILGNSPLHLAVNAHKEAIFKLLLQTKSDINLRNWSGETPLVCAVKKDFVSAVKELLLHGAVVSVSTDNGSTPLHVAVKKSSPNLDIIIELLKYDADIFQLDSKLNFPLLLAVKRYYRKPFETLHLAKTLLKFDALQKCYRNKGFKCLDELKNFNVFSELTIFYQACISEVSRMKSELIQSNLSILECSVKTLTDPKIVPGSLLQKELTMQQAFCISAHFPIYRAIIASCLRKTDIQNLLLDLNIFANKDLGDGSLQSITLNGDLTHLISFYLSKVDILNLIIAFYAIQDTARV